MSVVISCNRSSETIVVDEGVPVDPTDAGGLASGTFHNGSIKRIPSATTLASAIVHSSTTEPIDLYSLTLLSNALGILVSRDEATAGIEAVWVEADVEVTHPALMAVVALESVVSPAGESESASSNIHAEVDGRQALHIMLRWIESGWLVEGRIVVLDAACAVNSGDGKDATEWWIITGVSTTALKPAKAVRAEHD
jgi:hypothetical protein